MKKQLVMLVLSACLFSVSYGQPAVNELSFGPRQETSGNTLDDIVAVVNNDVITRREISRFAPKDRKVALQNLIMRTLLLQAAKQHNIGVGDTAINKASKGKMSRQALQDKLIIEKLQQQVAASYVQISDMEVADMVEKQLQQSADEVRLVDVLVQIPKTADAEALNKAQMLASEILAKLKKQSGQSVAAQYPNVRYNDLGWVRVSQVPTSFAKVLIGAELNAYSSPIVDMDGIHLLKVLDRKGGAVSTIPEAKVRHILIRDKGNPQAKQMIDNIYQQLKKGAKFSDVAQQFSQDPGSATNGGDLGWVRPGQMVSAFEQMMFSTKTGKMSRPFKSRFGYHILTVEQRRKAPVNNRKLLEVKAKQAIFQRRAAEEWDMWMARLREEAHVEIRDKDLQ